MASDIKLIDDDVVVEGTLNAEVGTIQRLQCTSLSTDALRVNSFIDAVEGLQTGDVKAKQLEADIGTIQRLQCTDLSTDALRVNFFIDAVGGLQTGDVSAKNLSVDNAKVGDLLSARTLQAGDITTNHLKVNEFIDAAKGVQTGDVSTRNLKADDVVAERIGVRQFLKVGEKIEAVVISADGLQVKNVVTTTRLRVVDGMQLGGRLVLAQHNSTDLVELVFKLVQRVEELEKQIVLLQPKP